MNEDSPFKNSNSFHWISLATSAWIITATVWIHAGIWPVRLSLREPGFDKLEYFIGLAALSLITWGTAIPSYPRFPALLAAATATLILVGGVIAIG